MPKLNIWVAIALLPVAGAFAWSSMKIGQHLAMPSSPSPSPGIYAAALLSAAVFFGAVRIATRARDRRSETTTIALAREQLRRDKQAAPDARA